MQRYPRPLLVEINLTNVFVEEASVALYKRIEEHILSTMRLNIGNKRVSSVPNVNLIGKNIHSKSEKKSTFCHNLLTKNQLS